MDFNEGPVVLEVGMTKVYYRLDGMWQYADDERPDWMEVYELEVPDFIDPPEIDEAVQRLINA